MRPTNQRSQAKMAAGSDLLDDVFFSAEIDEKVVHDLVGSLESELSETGDGEAPGEPRSAGNRTRNSAAGSNSNVQGSKMGLSQQEPAKAETVSQGSVLSTTGSHDSSVDRATGTASAAGPHLTVNLTEPKTPAAAVVAPESTTGIGKPGSTGVQTSNGSTVAVNSLLAGAGTSNGSNVNSTPSITTINNGPVGKTNSVVLSTTPSTIIRAQNAATVISSQPGTNSLSSITHVRASLQPPIIGTPNALSQPAGLPASVASAASTSGPSKAGIQAAPATGAPLTPRSPTVLQNVRTSVATAVPASSPGGVRAIASQVLAPRPAQQPQSTPNIQNIQLPAGMVLVRSESGQLLMIHQQTLAQVQAQSQSQSAMTPRPVASTSTPSVQIASLQAPGTSLVARQVNPTTIIKQSPSVQTTVLASAPLQRPPLLQNTIMVGGTASTPGQLLGTPTTVHPGSAATAVTQRVGPLGTTGTAATPTPVTAETLDNVKKCRNFLSTLIKLASSGKQSSETTANVKELVKSLLEATIEADDFTCRLYRELNSSPQPYLVPFLKRSLPALRQMTPDPEAFIHQSLLPQPASQPASASSTALKAVVLRPPLSTTTATTVTSTTRTKATVISLTQTPHTKAALQHGTAVRPQMTLAQSPMVTVRGQAPSCIIMGQSQVVRQLQTVPAKKPSIPTKPVIAVSQASLIALQKNKLKEAGGGTFRDDDDINDVASMAGVNLSEESARILATSSDIVGTVTRSCKDEPFISIPSLTRRVVDIGKKYGVRELGADVINYISHATHQRLLNLVERVSHVAQQRSMTFKEDERYEQISDVRVQLKFFEQLDQMERQRKDEQEREILLKAAKSRSRQEDPEQLRLKQKAKEMQQQELAQIRQREANLTALAAIGPRKKRKMDSPLRGASAEGQGSDPSQPGGASTAGSRQFLRHRITRVNLRDLLFCLENERRTSHSQLLYKGFLK